MELSASSAESFAKAALSPNKTIDEKIELVAKAMIELAKTIGTMERDISRIKNGVNAIRPEADGRGRRELGVTGCRASWSSVGSRA